MIGVSRRIQEINSNALNWDVKNIPPELLVFACNFDTIRIITGEAYMAKSIVLLVIIILIAMSFIMRPGLYILSPMPGFSNGTMLVYFNRHAEVPFFYSTNLQCLQSTGNDSESCRGAAYRNTSSLRERTLFRLPFSEWAFMRSLENYQSSPR